MAKWVCTVCGYVYEGENPPAECPVCHVGADKFKKVEGDLTLAAEHEFGVYASTVKNNPEISDEDKKYIFEQLKANFEGECSEVGMYLCMARVAHREVIRRSVFTGRRQLTKRLSMQLSLQRCSVRTLSLT